MSELPGKPPRLSLTEKTEIVLPQHTNAIGSAFGGTIMSWIDICAAVSAQRHCGRVAVTASVDALQFRAPIRLGDVVLLHSQVNAVFNTSMEVGVLVQKEDPATGARIVCADSLLTFVNLDDEGKPCGIPALLPETDAERERMQAAQERRERRLESRKKR